MRPFEQEFYNKMQAIPSWNPKGWTWRATALTWHPAQRHAGVTDRQGDCAFSHLGDCIHLDNTTN
jgi:hypothetical protein